MTLVERLKLVSRTTSIFAFSVRISFSSIFAFRAPPLALLSSNLCDNARLTHPATERNGRKTLTTVQGLPKKFDQKKILKVIKKKFACNGTVVADTEMGEVIQLQGDQRKDVQDFLTDKKEGLGLDTKTIKVHGF
jgi:translation initiation factor SUI1